MATKHNAAKEFSRLLLASFTCLLVLSACGGGGTGSPADDSATNESNTDNSDGDNTSGDADNGATHMRVARVRYDFDNNGVFEGTREYEYDTNGRIVQERYTYVDDGTPDISLAGTLSNSVGLDPLDETVTYAYDADGRLQTWTGRTSETRQTLTYTFDNDDLITRVDASVEDGSGAVTSRYHHTLTYSGQRLVGHTMTVDGQVSPMQEYEIGYDASGYVVSNRQTNTDTGLVSLYAYTYLSNGRPDTITDTVSSLPSYLMTFEFGYDASDRPAYLHFLSQGISTNRFSIEEQYDGNGRHIARHIDEQLDGTMDATAQIEWEDGPCSQVLTWYPRAVVTDHADPASPYLPGTGYVILPHCTDGI